MSNAKLGQSYDDKFTSMQIGKLKARNAELEAQVEVLQNRCARRGLSPEDSDALEARNAKLEGVIPIVRDFLWIAVCYNDHNFEVRSIQDKFRKTCEDLGVTSVESANAFLAALGEGDDEDL